MHMFIYFFFPKQKVRDNIKVVYNTALPVIFGVKKYADALWDVCKRRNITVNVQTNLIKIDPATEEAVFQKLDGSNETFVEKVYLYFLYKVSLYMCVIYNYNLQYLSV